MLGITTKQTWLPQLPPSAIVGEAFHHYSPFAVVMPRVCHSTATATTLWSATFCSDIFLHLMTILITHDLMSPFWHYPYTDSSLHANTTVTGCTYTNKANGRCISTYKSAHKLCNTCIATYLSKTKDSDQANLFNSDIFAEFALSQQPKESGSCFSQPMWIWPQEIIPSFELHQIMLFFQTSPDPRKNSGYVFAMIWADNPCRVLSTGKLFTHDIIPSLATHFRFNSAALDQFNFAKLPMVFLLP